MKYTWTEDGSPTGWSENAKFITKSKYCRDGETIKDLLVRVPETLFEAGWEHKYFDSYQEAEDFGERLLQYLYDQKFSFNSPVWFNLGVTENPQCSACFILSVDDSMDSIQEWWGNEATIFRGGSGSGVNLSSLRGSHESINGKGTSSGPVSFMRAADSIAGSIKSGGKTRRAAKMVILNADHPDIEEFIWCKAKEERKAYALRNAGFDTGINGDSGASLGFQNANNSVRVSDAFMQAVEEDKDWELRECTTGKVSKVVKARDLFRQIAQAAWECGDPGLQFDGTINAWNTCAAIGRINASNPCSEYMHLDNTACNLASINLMKFKNEGSFDYDNFIQVVRDVITAMDIIIEISSYPTEEITRNVKEMRQLGIGFTNLGAYLVSVGLPYDSDAGRQLTAKVTREMTHTAYGQSIALASRLGPYKRFYETSEDMVKVLEKHGYNDLAIQAQAYGIRNSQISVIAPTGTISFMMDCDTTGIEPMIALKSTKELVGGEKLTLLQPSMLLGLRALGYSGSEIDMIMDGVQTDSWKLSVKNEADLKVFETALGGQGVNTITPEAHLKMMAAVQPYISGAISKTVNMPVESTVEDVEGIYMEAWRLGLKSIAIYRDGSKAAQPVHVQKVSTITSPLLESNTQVVPESANREFRASSRKKLPQTRHSITHKFNIGEHEGYMIVGEYDDSGQPGEVFLTMSKEGSTLSGLLDAWATSISLLLQYGVPLEDLVRKFRLYRFEPSGFTGNKDIPTATSIVDYIFAWLERRYLNDARDSSNSIYSDSSGTVRSGPGAVVQDGVACFNCGSLMQRTGSCFACKACGETTGCG